MANNKERLVLGHVFLYAKGWYRYTKGLWEGYRRAIIADGHYMPETIHETAYLLYQTLVHNKEKILGYRDDYEMYIFDNIQKTLIDIMYWQKEFIKDMNPAQVHSLAVIWFCHNVFQTCQVNIFDEILIPSNKVMLLTHHYDVKNNGEEYHKHIATWDIFRGRKPYDREYEYGKSSYKSLQEYHPLRKAIHKGELHYEGINC